MRPLVAAAAVNAAAGTLFAWSVFLPAMTAEFAVPVGELGGVFSTALVVFALAVLFGGSGVDRYGPRGAAGLAGLLSGGGLALAAAAPGVLVVHAGFGVLFGVGSGLAYLSAVSWASTRGGQRRARGVGIVVAAYAAGPIVAAPLGAFASDRWGWRAALTVGALGVAVVTLLASRGLPGPVPGSPPVDDRHGATHLRDAGALGALWLLFLAATAPGLLAFACAAQIAAERACPRERRAWSSA